MSSTKHLGLCSILISRALVFGDLPALLLTRREASASDLGPFVWFGRVYSI
jgi:hypothetical protein